jgi:NTE family protein
MQLLLRRPRGSRGSARLRIQVQRCTRWAHDPAKNPSERRIAIACQGGGSHAAFTAGVLRTLLQRQNAENYRIIGRSGTSGGAMCALLAREGLLKGGVETAVSFLERF